MARGHWILVVSPAERLAVEGALFASLGSGWRAGCLRPLYATPATLTTDGATVARYVACASLTDAEAGKLAAVLASAKAGSLTVASASSKAPRTALAEATAAHTKGDGK